MTIYHSHHIVPKHIGGSDDPSNIVLLTISEHAEAHRILYEKYGRWQDKLAWRGLEGLIDKGHICAEIGRKQFLKMTQTQIPCDHCGRLISMHNMSRHLFLCTNGQEGVKGNPTRSGITLKKWGGGSKCITDGTTTKRIPKEDSIPEGWRLGRHWNPRA